MTASYTVPSHTLAAAASIDASLGAQPIPSPARLWSSRYASFKLRVAPAAITQVPSAKFASLIDVCDGRIALHLPDRNVGVVTGGLLLLLTDHT